MKINILVFDTETSGKPKHYGNPEDDLSNYPYVVQYCGQIIEVDTENLDKYRVIYSINSLVKPIREGKAIKIEEGAYNVHHISEEKALAEGNDIYHIAMIHQGMCNSVDFVVAHNYVFDRGVMVSELLRLGIKNTAKKGCQAFCTMKYSTGVLQLPSTKGYGFKFPTLAELYKYCTDRNINEDHKAHDAQGDVNATIISLFHLIKNKSDLLGWLKGEIKQIY